MKNKAVFLDRDGTINVEKDYLYKIEDFEFLPGVIRALRRLQEKGYLLIIITNQSGIARGYYDEESFLRLNDWMIGTLEDNGVRIAKTYYCPHLPNASVPGYDVDCTCRKPKTGLYELAVDEFDLALGACYAVGDKIRDCCICETTECRGFLIAHNEKEEIIRRVKSGEVRNVRYAESLEAAGSEIP